MATARYSFVVELEPPGKPFTGRVEHVLSGLSLRFDSAEALLAFIERALSDRHTISPGA